jgi:MoaA/NifB/PqqE/SkfB family radical SAM enzyme
MINALTYLTRACTRKCTYCALRDARDMGPELSLQDWLSAFKVLEKMNVDFNLVLGNETWLLGNQLKDLFKQNKISYALYTTCPSSLFRKYRDLFLSNGVIDNVSCGLDYPILEEPVDDDSYWKSVDAWAGLEWVKQHYPMTDCQGTVTIHRGNYRYLPEIVGSLAKMGVFCGANFIHWNSDGGFDFFPNEAVLKDYLFRDKDLPHLRNVLDEVLENPGLLQNPEMLREPVEDLTRMGWHCGGNPYGGPTIDADGSLRVCGYRKGERTSQFSIFSLPERTQEWRQAVFLDARDCPGCVWSYPWMYHYWQERNSVLGKDVFVKHAGEHIPEKQWSERRRYDGKK